MIKKPFKPEERACKICGETFFASKPLWKCKACISVKAKEVSRMRKEMGMTKFVKKESYPIPENKKNNHFRRLQAKLKKMHRRHEWKKYLSDRLDEVMQDERMMKWIWDRRDTETIQMNKKKKYGIEFTKQPSTKSMPYDV
jgi:hypothetical protein